MKLRETQQSRRKKKKKSLFQQSVLYENYSWWLIYQFNYCMLGGGLEVCGLSHIIHSRKKSLPFLESDLLKENNREKLFLAALHSFPSSIQHSTCALQGFGYTAS